MQYEGPSKIAELHPSLLKEAAKGFQTIPCSCFFTFIILVFLLSATRIKY